MSQLQNQTHFELFGISESFDIDLEDLSQRYRELQRLAHPDKFANASDRERRVSVEKAAAINEAYQVLKSPQKRARYMLELQSVSFDDEKDTMLAPEFLMEQIELREELSEITQSPDPLTSLNKIMLDIKQRIAAVVEDLRQIMLQGELDKAHKDNARQLIQKMQFLTRLQQEAENQEENLLDAL
jgi:molecular chaperone HscB